MYETSHTFNKVDKVIEQTVTECNRVFKAWVLNKKRTIYEDELSLLKSYLTRFIKREYTFQATRRINWFNPLCVVENNRIKSISLTSANTEYTEYDRVLNMISERLKTFDFDHFDQKLRLEEMLVEQKPKEIRHLVDVSFDDIENIKF
jgi:hypothetical protein